MKLMPRRGFMSFVNFGAFIWMITRSTWIEVAHHLNQAGETLFGKQFREIAMRSAMLYM